MDLFSANPRSILERLQNELKAATQIRAHPFQWPTLGTSSGVRMVVLRQVDLQAETVTFYTDRRAQKVSDISRNPEVELCFYHPTMRWQLRYFGKGSKENSEEVLNSYWDKLSLSQKRSYAANEVPGSPLEKPTFAFSKGWSELDEVKSSDQEFARSNFAAYHIKAKTLDLLMLDGEYPRRCKWENFNADSFTWISP